MQVALLPRLNELILLWPTPNPAFLEIPLLLYGTAFNVVFIWIWFALAAFLGSLTSSTSAMHLVCEYGISVVAGAVLSESAKALIRTPRPPQLVQAHEKHGQTRQRRSSFEEYSTKAGIDTTAKTKALQRWFSFPRKHKSHHSMPSGDAVQAMVATVFWALRGVRWCGWPSARCLPDHGYGSVDAVAVLFLATLFPGVALARVYYRCHWVEDVIAGGLLGAAIASAVHLLILPQLSWS